MKVRMSTTIPNAEPPDDAKATIALRENVEPFATNRVPYKTPRIVELQRGAGNMVQPDIEAARAYAAITMPLFTSLFTILNVTVAKGHEIR